MPTEEAITQFYTAAKRGNFELLQEMAAGDPELVTTADRNCFNYRLLNYGAWQNRRDYIDLALSHGTAIDQPCEFWAGDWTALQHAINYGQQEIAEYLVERGARVDVHGAAGLPRLQALGAMLSQDSYLVNQRGGDGTTPLHFAASPEVVDLLLDHGAEIDARDVDHYSTPAQWAANDRAEVALHLVSRSADPDIFMLVAALDGDRISEFLADNPQALFERISTERFPPSTEHPDLRCIYFFSPSMGPMPQQEWLATSESTPKPR